MYKYLTVLMVCLVVAGSGVVNAEPYSQPGTHYEQVGNMWFDSLNVRFIGNWPFGLSLAVSYDATRNLTFCGSGGGVYIVDVSDPTNPVKVSESIHTRGSVNGLFYDSNTQRLYIAAGVAGLEIWDITDDSNPLKLGYYDTPGRAYGVYVSGSYAYVADWNAGLRVIDVSTPSNPFEVGYYDTPGNALGVYVSGSYAYVADYWSGFRVIDVSTPSNPFEVGYYDTPDYAYGVYVSGSYAYVADYWSGLRVIDISTPSNPSEVGYYDTPGYALGVYVSGSYAYVVDGSSGLRVIDVSTPSNPSEVGYYDTPCVARGVYVLDSYAYVADGYGLQIYEFLGVGIEEAKNIVSHSGLRLLQNPVRGNYIELQFSIPQSDNIGLNLYNLSGQRVRSFSVNGPSSDYARLSIEGLTNGTYFLRLKQGSSNQSVKVTIIK